MGELSYSCISRTSVDCQRALMHDKGVYLCALKVARKREKKNLPTANDSLPSLCVHRNARRRDSVIDESAVAWRSATERDRDPSRSSLDENVPTS